MSDLKVGDVVRLNSGGLKMTIMHIGNYSDGAKADCAWFDKDMNNCESQFAVGALKKVGANA